MPKFVDKLVSYPADRETKAKITYLVDIKTYAKTAKTRQGLV